jgi:hypothetical protein
MKQSKTLLEKELKHLEKDKHTKFLAVAEAEKDLMDCVGPRKLQNMIETRRKHGIPLPFRVSIRKHSRYALVEYLDDTSIHGDDLASIDEELGVVDMSHKKKSHRDGDNGFGFGEDATVSTAHIPGEWRKKLKIHDRIFIKGIEYQVIPTMNMKKSSKKKKKDASTSEKDASGGGDNSNKDHSEGGSGHDGSSSTKKKKAGTTTKAVVDSSAKDSSDGGGKDASGMANKGNEEQMEGKELIEEITLNHIALDHPWMLDDVYGVEVNKLATTVFYMKPIKSMKRFFIRLYVIQKIIAMLAIFNHKLSLFFHYFLSWFDETTSTYAFCNSRITSSINNRNYFLSLSIYIIILSFDFTLRRKIGNQCYKIYLLFMMIAKNIYNIYKTLTSNLSETPYEYWQRSLEKENVRIIYELNGNESIILGDFKMDAKAPVEILREYINRRYRIKLNETIGESYLFMRVNLTTGKEEFCLRDDEFKIPTKEFALMKEDAKTFESILTATIVKDKERGKLLIKEFHDDFDDIGSVEKVHDDHDDDGSLDV